MSEWKECRLGEICSRLSSGKNISATKIQKTGTYPVFGGNGLRGYTNELNFIGECSIIGRQGAFCGNVRYFKGKAYMTEHAVIVCADQNNDTHYLSYLLSTMQLGSLSSQSAQPGISVKTLSNLKIPLPPLDTQRKIASILSALDDKIELNRRMNENLNQIIIAYYHNMFNNCKCSATINDYASKIFSGGTPSTSNENYWNGNYKWLSSGETSQKFIVETEKTITKEGIQNSSTRLASKYDTVIASAGQGHTRGQTSMLFADSYVNQSIIVIDSEMKYMPFIFYNISRRYDDLRTISHSNSIRGSLTTKMIAKLSAPQVDERYIIEFSEFAWPIIYQIEKACIENINFAALRDTLLPKLMRGEIDVENVRV